MIKEHYTAMKTNYAKELTRKFLEQNGITEITKDARVFKGDREIFPVWNGKETNTNSYLCLVLCARDEDGHLVKKKDYERLYTKKDGTISKHKSWFPEVAYIGLHRIVWAWHNGSVPAGMVVDHINNKHKTIEDYHLDNLQLLTPRENLAKDRDDWDIRELKCRLDKPRSYYEDRLLKFQEQYEEAKMIRDAQKAHTMRSQVSNYKAKLRYYDSHITEANELLKQKEDATTAKANKLQDRKDLAMIKALKIQYKQEGNNFMWHQLAQIERNWNSYDSATKEALIKAILKK